MIRFYHFKKQEKERRSSILQRLISIEKIQTDDDEL